MRFKIFIGSLCLCIFSFSAVGYAQENDDMATSSEIDSLNAKIEKLKLELEVEEHKTKKKAQLKQQEMLEKNVIFDSKGRPVPGTGFGPEMKGSADGQPVVKALYGKENDLRAELLYSDGTVLKIRNKDQLPDGSRVVSISRDGVTVRIKKKNNRLRFARIANSEFEEGGDGSSQ